MGNIQISPVSPQSLDYCLHDLTGITLEEPMGNARFLKTLKSLHDEGTIVVKVYIKRKQQEELKAYEEKLKDIKTAFSTIDESNLLAYQKVEETDKAGFLQRQYIWMNLTDRIGTRPFLTFMEKRWIAYQLLRALTQCHQAGICHGDIKSENILVTSWNWIYLSDFAPFKPTHISALDTIDFSFFFDSSGKRTCYIAPERFYSEKPPADKRELTPTMDIFSMGCVIAELFLEGPLFDFSQMTSYRKGEYECVPVINRIGDEHIQDMIKHMIQTDPDKRFTAQEYIEKWTDLVFPNYFGFLHYYVFQLMKLTPEEAIQAINTEYDEILRQLFSPNPLFCTPFASQRALERGFSSGAVQLPPYSIPSSPPPYSTFPSADLSAQILIRNGSVVNSLPQNPQQSDPNNNNNNNNNNSNNNASSTANPTNSTEADYDLLMKTENFIKNITELNHSFSDLPSAPTSSSSSSGDFKNYLPTHRDGSVHVVLPGPFPATTTPLNYVETKNSAPPGLSGPTIKSNLSSLSPEQHIKRLTDLYPTDSLPPIYGPDNNLSLSQQTSTNFPNNLTAVNNNISNPSLTQTSTNLGISSRSRDKSKSIRRPSRGLIILLNLVCSFLRHLDTPTSKLQSLDLFVSFSSNLREDEIRLQRIVPYSVSLVSDPVPLVRANAIRAITRVLDMVRDFPPSEAHLFTSYLLPSLSKIPEDNVELVRESYAENLAKLAEIAHRFLEASQSCKPKNSTSHKDDTGYPPLTYDKELEDIQSAFYELFVQLMTKDSSSSVKRALLKDITRLCDFLGRQRTNDEILPLIITFMNERDWSSRAAFFHDIVGVSVFVGMSSLEAFILPIIEDSLKDDEEYVIEKAVNSLAALSELGLFRKRIMLALLKKVSPLLLHPNIWIQYGVIGLVEGISKQLSMADVFCYVIPVIRPFLLVDIVSVNQSSLINALRTPPSRQLFQKAIQEGYALSPNGVGPNQNNNSEDPFTTNLLKRLKEKNPDADQESLEAIRLISDYLKLLINKIIMRPKSDQLSEAELWKDFSELARTTPIRALDFPLHANDSAISFMDIETRTQNDRRKEEWKKLFPKNTDQNLPLFQTLYGDPNSAFRRSMSTSSFGGGSGSDEHYCPFVAPPTVELGTLKRMDNNSSLAVTGESLKAWRPKGVLVAHFNEHSGAVNALSVSQDNMFFVSGSSDGTVLVWDCSRLEKNVTPKSRTQYCSQGGRITCLTVCEGSHSVASGSDNGTIHVFRVETLPRKDNLGTRYRGATVVKYLEPNDGPLVDIKHFNTKHSQSLLVYATNRGKIHGWDLRAKREAWIMKNPLTQGLVSSFTTDPSHNWLVVGTSRGYNTVWDMRFTLPVRSWRHPDNVPIHKLLHCRSSTPEKATQIFCAGGEGEVSIWDVKGGMTRLLRVLECDERGPVPNLKASEDSLTGTLPEKQIQDSLLHYYSVNPSFIVKTLDAIGTELQKRNALRAPKESNIIRTLWSPPESQYLITAGSDRKIRYWDLRPEHVKESYVISGLEENQPKPKYSFFREDALIIQESPNSPDTLSNPTSPMHPSSSGTSSGSSSSAGGGTTLPNVEEGVFRAPVPSTAHRDCILDLTVTELPQRMLISGSRDGVVQVFL